MNIFLLVGASGVGKTSLGSCLRDLGIPELISHSTRPTRSGESEAQPYYFVTREQFDTIPMIERTEYNGNWYGTSRAEIDRVLSQGKSAFAIVDQHGAEQFLYFYGEKCKVIFVWTPPLTAIDRMKARGDSEEMINKRMLHAYSNKEFKLPNMADYCIVNKDLESAVRQLKAIVSM